VRRCGPPADCTTGSSNLLASVTAHWAFRPRPSDVIASHMSMKKGRLLIWIMAVTLGVVIAWKALRAQPTTIQIASPDAAYVATVRSTFPFSGGYKYDIEVRRSDGTLVSHLVAHDRVVGWPRNPSITWTPDSRTVTIGLQDGDTDGAAPVARKRLSIDVK